MDNRIRSQWKGRRKALFPVLRGFGIAMALGLLPVVAFAHDDDAPAPLDPKSKAEQLTSLGVIAAVVALGLALYLYRRWQAASSTNVVHGFEGDQD